MTETPNTPDDNAPPPPQTPPPEGGPAEGAPAAPAEGAAGGLVSAESPDAKTMAMLCHLLAIFTGFLAPLIIWLIKKDQSPFVDQEGKEALNFQLTMLIAFVIGGLTTCLIIGFFIIAAASIVDIIFCVLAAITVNKGQGYRYPFCIRFIK